MAALRTANRKTCSCVYVRASVFVCMYSSYTTLCSVWYMMRCMHACRVWISDTQRNGSSVPSIRRLDDVRIWSTWMHSILSPGDSDSLHSSSESFHEQILFISSNCLGSGDAFPYRLMLWKFIWIFLTFSDWLIWSHNNTYGTQRIGTQNRMHGTIRNRREVFVFFYFSALLFIHSFVRCDCFFFYLRRAMTISFSFS